MKDKIENIITATESKEIEINSELIDDYDLAYICRDGNFVGNLKILSDAIAKSDDASSL